MTHNIDTLTPEQLAQCREERPCTCPATERPFGCPQKYALSECVAAWETAQNHAECWEAFESFQRMEAPQLYDVRNEDAFYIWQAAWSAAQPCSAEQDERTLEIYEFSYPKYGEHVVALRNSSVGGGVQLFDTVKLFAQNNTLKEYERVKDEAASFAKKFVAQFNNPPHQSTSSGSAAQAEMSIDEKILDRVIEKANDFYGIPIGMAMGRFIIESYQDRFARRNKDITPPTQPTNGGNNELA